MNRPRRAPRHRQHTLRAACQQEATFACTRTCVGDVVGLPVRCPATRWKSQQSSIIQASQVPLRTTSTFISSATRSYDAKRFEWIVLQSPFTLPLFRLGLFRSELLLDSAGLLPSQKMTLPEAALRCKPQEVSPVMSCTHRRVSRTRASSEVSFLQGSLQSLFLESLILEP